MIWSEYGVMEEMGMIRIPEEGIKINFREKQLLYLRWNPKDTIDVRCRRDEDDRMRQSKYGVIEEIRLRFLNDEMKRNFKY